ncbi:MAG: OmpA family protein, partial [Bacteroidota bacterium]
MKHLIFFMSLCLSAPLFAQQMVRKMVHFPSDQHVLDQEAERFLSDVVKNLNAPFTCYTVEIIGHTDADGSHAYNVALSERRATSVRRFFLDAGFQNAQFQVHAQGENIPTASNLHDGGKAQNRRVEIRLTTPQGQCDRIFDFDVAWHKVRQDASSALDFTYNRSGTHVFLPAHSLQHADGRPVEGEVTYLYREWRDPAEFLASGIPMGFPFRFSKQHFHSGGMFEIRAMQDGQALNLRDDRAISVDFIKTDDDDYDLFRLNDQSQSWATIP